MKIKPLVLSAALFGILSFGGSKVAQAATKPAPGYLDIKYIKNHRYLITKRDVKTKLYRKVNGRNIQYVIPKGTKLLISGGFDILSFDSQRRAKFIVTLTFAQMSYAFQSSFDNWKAEDYSLLFQRVALKSSNFKWAPTNLPAVVGTKWEEGKDYHDNNGSHQMFTVTQDNYLQFYSAATIKKAGITDTLNSHLGLIKPTTSRKLIKIKPVDKKVTYLYYNKPITGLNEYKVRSGLYRLKINVGEKKSSHLYDDYGEQYANLDWQRAFIGGKHYNQVLNLEYGD